MWTRIDVALHPSEPVWQRKKKHKSKSKTSTNYYYYNYYHYQKSITVEQKKKQKHKLLPCLEKRINTQSKSTEPDSEIKRNKTKKPNIEEEKNKQNLPSMLMWMLQAKQNKKKQ